LHGARLRIVGTGYVLPFYVTHIRGDQEKASSNIVSTVLANWIEGDLPPIVVGDFNTSPEIDAMKPYFVEIENGRSDVEHIWVGCGDAFINPRGTWSPVPSTYDPGDEFDDPRCHGEREDSSEYQWTYHNVPSVELRLNLLRDAHAQICWSWQKSKIAAGDFNGDGASDATVLYGYLGGDTAL